MLSVGVFLALHASTSAGSTWHTRQAVLYRYESSCVHAPVSQAVVGSFDVMTNANNAAGRLFSINSNSNSNDDDVSRMILPEEVVSTPRPEHCLADADLPNMWDWRNVTIARGAPVSCNALDVNSSRTLYIYISNLHDTRGSSAPAVTSHACSLLLSPTNIQQLLIFPSFHPFLSSFFQMQRQLISPPASGTSFFHSGAAHAGSVCVVTARVTTAAYPARHLYFRIYSR